MIKNLGRKVVSATAAAALAATSVVALGGVAANAAESTTITVYAPVAFNVPYNPYKKVADLFEAKYPKYTVKFVEGAGAADYGTGLVTALQAGNAADVFKVAPGIGQKDSILTLARAKFLMDLSGTNAAKTNPAGVRANFGGAKTYGVGLEQTSGSIIVNWSLMEADGISKYPTTWNELLSACKVATSKGHAFFVLPAGYGASANMIIASLAGNVYGKDPTWTNKRLANKTTFASTQGWIDIFTQIQELDKAGCFLEGGKGATTRDFIDANFIGKKNVYAMFGPGNIAKQFSTAPFFKGYTLKTGYIPAKTGKTTIMSDVNYAFAVNAKTKAPTAAKLFINFAASAEGQAAFQSLNGGIPLTGVTTVEQFSLIQPFLKSKSTHPQPLSAYTGPAVEAAQQKGVQALLLGATTITKILGTMDRAW